MGVAWWLMLVVPMPIAATAPVPRDITSRVGVAAIEKFTIRVGRSGNADAATIAGGVALVPLGRWTERWTVAVEPGGYRERVWVNASMGPLTLTGLGAPEETLLVYHCCYRGDGSPRCSNASADPSCAPLHPGPGTGPNRVTSRTGTLLIEAADFVALNITVANDACDYDSRRAEQSQAVQALADRTAFRHTRVLGAQDTLFGGNAPVTANTSSSPTSTAAPIRSTALLRLSSIAARLR